jgi:hypothetical protein
MRPTHNTGHSRTTLLAAALVIVIFTIAACGSAEQVIDPEEFDPLTSVPAALDVRSPDFKEGERIPTKFTCDGEDEPPVISWAKPPAGTRAVAVIFDDPDAPGGIFTHWTVFNLEPGQNRLAGSIGSDETGPTGPFEGLNDFGAAGYGGPCPPGGAEHTYRFNVFALIAPLALETGAPASEVITAMRGTVIGYGVLTGTYSRP